MSIVDKQGQRRDYERHDISDRITALVGAGLSLRAVAALVGLSHQSVKHLAHELPRLQPRLQPLTGVDPAWDPLAESVSPETCTRCGGDAGPIAPGSPLVCLACLRSGCDSQVAANRLLDVLIEQQRAEAEAEARKAALIAKWRRKAGA